MYEYLNGELAHILPTAIVVDVHGVGYHGFCKPIPSTRFSEETN